MGLAICRGGAFLRCDTPVPCTPLSSLCPHVLSELHHLLSELCFSSQAVEETALLPSAPRVNLRDREEAARHTGRLDTGRRSRRLFATWEGRDVANSVGSGAVSLFQLSLLTV